MNPFLKYYFALFVVFILAIPIQSYSSDTTLTQVKLQLKWKHQFQFAGYYAAIEKGYYKELGIEVELVEANVTESPIDALISGKAQFATSTSDIILLRAAGRPVVLLATIFQHSAQVLLVSGTSKIEYVHNLAGKRLIIEPHAADIIAYMKDEGVPLNKVIQLPHSFNINMLVENKADAMTAYLTDEPFLLQQQNFDYKIFSPISGNIDFYGDILITSEQLLKDNPKLALDFRTASIKGWEYAMKNSDEIIELIYNKYSKRHSKEHLAFEAEKMKKLILPNVVPIGYSNHRRWEKTVKIYQEIGLLDADADITGLFYTDYINKLNIPWNIIIPFSLIFLFLSSIAFFFYRITQKLKFQIKHNKSIGNTLKKTEKEYQTYFDQGMLGMAKTSLEKGWIEVNDVICNMFGYSREEFVDLTWDKMTYPDDLEKDLLQFKRVQAGEIDNYSMDKRFFRKNGDIFHSSLTVNTVRKADGSIDYMIAILNDITERKKTEKALRDSEMRWQFAVDGSELGLWDWDIPNNKVFFSKQWKEMLGYEDDEIGNTSEEWSERIHPDDKEKVFEDVQKHTDGKMPVYKNEHRLQCKDGSYKWILSKGISVATTDDGKPKRMLGTHADISKRKSDEEKIKKFSTGFEQTSNTIVITDINGNIEYVNPRFTELSGYSAKEVYKQNPRILNSGTQPKEYFAELWKTILSGKTWKGEFHNKKKNGEYYWENSIITPVRNEKGEINSFIAIKEDTTLRKKAEQALKESEEKYRLITENVSDVIWILNVSKNKFTYISPAEEKITGYTAKESLQQSISERFSQESAKKAEETIRTTTPKFIENPSNKITQVNNFQQKCKDGSFVWIEVSSNFRYNPANEIEIIGTSRNIDKRKKAELALKESEEKFRNFIDKNKAIIISVDPSTNRILIANKAAVDFYGYSKAELINKSMAEINVLSADEISKIASKAGGNKLNTFHFKHKLANNEIRDIEGYPSPVKVGDKTHLLIIIFDITERKKAAEALKNSEAELKELNITKDKFFSIIAHDLKSPFNAIIGFSKILLEGHKEYDEEKREGMIKIVNSSAVRAFKLLENLLTWSRSHSGRIPYIPEELYLKTLLIETLYNQEGQASKKNIKITDTIHENELVFVDENMIATVLRNLISNAIKFTPKNGNIVISSEKLTNSNFIKISVKDTGVGIPKDKIDDLFHIDKNISTQGTEKETGTGLGLILCKEFVEKHGGKIWVESEAGKGSTFMFTLPVI
ncbi:MAG: hypothetical protein DRJ07_06640 [Bacteroidetes bacterium]|nr:MAG: hypothetical protein DRJ07_06640 [Bacteroidota bacterium]